jgi:hypothetical protein
MKEECRDGFHNRCPDSIKNHYTCGCECHGRLKAYTIFVQTTVRQVAISEEEALRSFKNGAVYLMPGIPDSDMRVVSVKDA